MTIFQDKVSLNYTFKCCWTTVICNLDIEKKVDMEMSRSVLTGRSHMNENSSSFLRNSQNAVQREQWKLMLGTLHWNINKIMQVYICINPSGDLFEYKGTAVDWSDSGHGGWVMNFLNWIPLPTRCRHFKKSTVLPSESGQLNLTHGVVWRWVISSTAKWKISDTNWNAPKRIHHHFIPIFFRH